MSEMNINLDPFIFVTDFDSSNLHSVELVPRQGQQAEAFNFHAPDYEVNIWTKPDCFGTPFQNGNRTWFHFGVRGGRPGAMVKFNILNLNKQVKLFLQGMQPVYRYLPQKPLWERVRDKLLVNEKEEHICSISFRQRLHENTTNSTMCLAFTYPFSYTDMTTWLGSVDATYTETSGPGCLPFDTFQIPSLSPSRAEAIVARSASFSTENDIYYYRECACLSLEGRRVELITLTSLCGISNEREARLANLFPNTNEERPFRFPNKKVVFLSARVHPGETPSTFVLNGFFKFLLEPKDPRAIILRRLFVFKFMPMLNPDGVSRGHYRTDPRGVNLNRVYLQPSPILHPSIYAAKKLVLYYHRGQDSPDDYEYETESNSTQESVSVFGKSILKENYSSAEEGESVLGFVTPSTSTTEFSTKLVDFEAVVSENVNVIKSSLCAGCVAPTNISGSKSKTKREPENIAELDLEDTNARLMEDSDISMSEPEPTHSGKPAFVLESEDSHQCNFESCDEDSVMDITDVKAGKSNSGLLFNNAPNLSIEIAGPSTKSPPKVTRQSRQRERRASAQSEKEDCDVTKLPSAQRKKRSGRLKQRNSSTSALKTPFSYKNPNVYNDSTSGLFAYIDMHGHATKRGIFMYGNHFNDPLVQSECMLLPRLMAMNCQHFDFSACNFTERLMNMKDRRDGASREGSGRVAVLKHTGLVRSYTLECNYNTGRLVNHVMNRPSSFGFNDPPMNPSPHPPKFTPELFEGTGKALAESILDLTGHNPWSRISNTDFRTLEGMRRWLLKRLQNSPDYKSKDPPLKMSTSLTGVLTTSLPSFELPQQLRARTRPAKGSTPTLRKGSSSKAKIPERPSVGPLVPKKENQYSNTSLAKPSGSKAKACPKEKATSSTPKIKAKAASASKVEPSVQTKGSIAKIFNAKRVPSRKKASKARTGEKSDSKIPLPK